MKDFYYILGTDERSSTVEIREAYRKLSKKFHPDLNQNDHYFEGRFKEVQEAYETLSDPIRRRQYDEQFRHKNRYAPLADEPLKRRSYPRTTAVDVIFTIVLIALTGLFGNYVWKSITSAKDNKPATVAAAPADTAASPIATFHHKKKKHSLKAIADNIIPQAAAEPLPQKVTQVSNAGLQHKTDVKPAAVADQPEKKTDTVKAQPNKAITPAAAPVAANSNNNSDATPYSSYLRSNITGVVNMHRLNDISSAIVAVIPANSKVTVLARGNSYYMVQYNNTTGYVPSWTVKTK
jgi:hypothetical protein